MQLYHKITGEGFPVIILHGLLGSSGNWQTVAKALATPTITKSAYCVYTIDLRNHGKSPHTAEFSYELLCADLFEFFEQHGIVQAHVIGHSMGGKVAMKFALEYPGKVSQLVVVDIAPGSYEDHHIDVFKALYAALPGHKNTREEVEAVLRQQLDDEVMVQFLMQNLQRAFAGEKGFRWRFNLDSLYKNYQRIAAAIDSDTAFKGETLFVKGEKSNYINQDNYPLIDKLFPNHRIEEIKDAAHWVQADKPINFVEVLRNFLR